MGCGGEMTKEKQPEKDLQKQCQEYLDKMGYRYIHIRNRVFKGSKRASSNKLKYWPDFSPVFLPNGKTKIFELKTKSKYSEEQVKRIVELERMGHKVYRCNTLEEFIKEVEG